MKDEAHTKIKVVEHLEENLEIEKKTLKGQIKDIERTHVTLNVIHFFNFKPIFYQKRNFFFFKFIEILTFFDDFFS